MTQLTCHSPALQTASGHHIFNLLLLIIVPDMVIRSCLRQYGHIYHSTVPLY